MLEHTEVEDAHRGSTARSSPFPVDRARKSVSMNSRTRERFPAFQKDVSEGHWPCLHSLNLSELPISYAPRLADVLKHLRQGSLRKFSFVDGGLLYDRGVVDALAALPHLEDLQIIDTSVRRFTAALEDSQSDLRSLCVEFHGLTKQPILTPRILDCLRRMDSLENLHLGGLGIRAPPEVDHRTLPCPAVRRLSVAGICAPMGVLARLFPGVRRLGLRAVQQSVDVRYVPFRITRRTPWIRLDSISITIKDNMPYEIPCAVRNLNLVVPCLDPEAVLESMRAMRWNVMVPRIVSLSAYGLDCLVYLKNIVRLLPRDEVKWMKLALDEEVLVTYDDVLDFIMDAADAVSSLPLVGLQFTVTRSGPFCAPNMSVQQFPEKLPPSLEYMSVRTRMTGGKSRPANLDNQWYSVLRDREGRKFKEIESELGERLDAGTY